MRSLDSCIWKIKHKKNQSMRLSFRSQNALANSFQPIALADSKTKNENTAICCLTIESDAFVGDKNSVGRPLGMTSEAVRREILRGEFRLAKKKEDDTMCEFLDSHGKADILILRTNDSAIGKKDRPKEGDKNKCDFPSCEIRA